MMTQTEPRTRVASLTNLIVGISIIGSAAAVLAAFIISGTLPGPTTNVAADGIHWTFTGPTSVALNWRGGTSIVDYGTTTSYDLHGTAVTPSPLPFSSAGPYWEARLTNLQPNTTYHYSIAGGPDHTFKTPPLAGTSGFTVMAQADIGSYPTYAQVQGVQQLIADNRPDFVLSPGDFTYANSSGHTQAEVDAHFNNVMAWSQDAAYMPAWGNHEWDKAADDLRNYKGRFDFPNPQTSPGCSGNNCGGEDWYWYDYGNVRFIAYPEPWSGAWSDWNTKARTLMDEAQANNNIKFIVTFGHRPAYSSGHHPGDNTLKGYLDALGASHSKYVMNVNGHSHNYERTKPQSGVTHLTVGTGGSSLETDTNSTAPCSPNLWLSGCPPPSYSAARFMHHGALKLVFTDTAIQGSFLCGPNKSTSNDITCTTGQIIDTFTIGTPTNPTLDTTAPVISNIVASNITTGAATITWTTNEGSTSQADYGLTALYGLSSTVNTSLVTTHTVSLTGLTPNSTYHYRLKSTDQAGNQAVSTDLTFVTNSTASSGWVDLVTDASLIFSTLPTMVRPGYLEAVTDTNFRTTINRITGNIGQSLSPLSGTWKEDARQHYSKDQPWNADQSLILVENKNGTPSNVILDGDTYEPRYAGCTSTKEDRWHPSLAHANERIGVNGNKLTWYNATNCQVTRTWTLPFSAHGIGPNEGNPSNDGRFLALTNNQYTDSATVAHAEDSQMIVVDMDPQAPLAAYPAPRIGPPVQIDGCGLSSCAVDWVSVSASGKYAMVSYDGDHPRVYDVSPSTLALSPRPMPTASIQCSGHSAADGYVYDLGHADFALNPFDNNEDVFIGQRRSWCPQSIAGKGLGSVIMVRLRDNAITSLTSPTEEADSRHISTRNLDRPGWAYVSYDPGLNRRFGGEIIAVKLDGSGSMEHYAHHHSLWTGCYRCESHPVPSRDGQRVIFASSWSSSCGIACGSSSDIKAFVIDARNPGSSGTCTPSWQCTNWSACASGQQTRVCTDANNCGMTDGKPGESQSCIMPDTTAPYIRMLHPTNSQVVSGSIELGAFGGDNVGITGLQYTIDGQRIDTVVTVPYYKFWDSRTVGNGPHTVGAVAWDAAGNTTTAAAVNITVKNLISSPSTATGVVDADTYLRGDGVNSNYGSAATMNLDGSPTRDLLIRFTVGDLGGKVVTGANLRLHASSDGSNGSGGAIYRVSSNTWNEKTVTWATAPAAEGSAIVTLGAVAAQAWAEFNITSIVNGPGTYSVRIKSTSGDGLLYQTKEYSDPGSRPMVTLTLSDPATATQAR